MSVLRRMFGIKSPEHVIAAVRSARDDERATAYEETIEGARGELRQSLQRLESGKRVMQTMEGVVLMSRGHTGG